MRGHAAVGDPLSISIGPLKEGIVVDRPNRFVAVVRLLEQETEVKHTGQGGSRHVGEDYLRDLRVKDGGESRVLCHVADSGRLKELIFPGNRVMVRKVPNCPGGSLARKTPCELVLAAVSCTPSSSPPPRGTAPVDSPLKDSLAWVSVDTRYPTKLLGQALRARAVPEFREYDVVRPEYPFHRVEQAWASEKREDTFGNERQPLDNRACEDAVQEGIGKRVPIRSRLDFYLEGTGVPPALVEVKSVTLCVDGLGLFPDAPTERGLRHLRELQKAVTMGCRAYVVFIAQREDITRVSANVETDLKFAMALEEAGRRGVRLLAYRCRVSPQAITLEAGTIPVIV